MYIVSVLLHELDEPSEILRQYVYDVKTEAVEGAKRLKEKYRKLYGKPEELDLGTTFFIGSTMELSVCPVVEANDAEELNEDASKFDIMSH